MTVLEQDEKIVREMGKIHGSMNCFEVTYVNEFGILANIDHLNNQSIKRRFHKAIEVLWAKGVCNRRYNGKKITYVFI